MMRSLILWSLTFAILSLEAQLVAPCQENPVVEQAAAVKRASFYDQMRVRVINLDRRPDRWKSFVERAGSQQLELYSRFPAIDGQTLVMTPEIQHLFRVEPGFRGKRHQIYHGYCKGILGCCLSHVTLWRELLQSPYEAYLILEDDAELCAHFVERWDELYSKHLRADGAWDLVYLGIYEDTPSVQRKYGDTVVCEGVLRFAPLMRQEGGGTFAYCIRKKGAQKLLDIVEKQGIQQAVDHFMIDQFDTLCVYHTYPPFATAKMYGIDGLDSDVQPESEAHDAIHSK